MRKLASLITALAFVSVTTMSFANEERVDIPLKLHEARETQISDLSIYQLKRRFHPFSESQAQEMKLQQEQKERFMFESVRDPSVQRRTLRVNLSVGSTDLDLFASVNFQTNLIFVDKQGEPWPIEKVGIGAQDFFNVEQYLPHAVQISPKRKYSRTNLTILLKGEVVPLVFTINEDKDKVDYLTQVKVSSLSPSTAATSFKRSANRNIQTKRTSNSEGHVVDMRDGLTPDGAKLLTLEKEGNDLLDVNAWQYEDSYYLRTQGELVIPAGELLSSGVDGFKLFKLPIVGLVMLESDGTIITEVKIKK